MNFLVAYKFYMKFQTYMNYFRANFLYVVTYLIFLNTTPFYFHAILELNRTEKMRGASPVSCAGHLIDPHTKITLFSHVGVLI